MRDGWGQVAIINTLNYQNKLMFTQVGRHRQLLLNSTNETLLGACPGEGRVWRGDDRRHGRYKESPGRPGHPCRPELSWACTRAPCVSWAPLGAPQAHPAELTAMSRWILRWPSARVTGALPLGSAYPAATREISGSWVTTGKATDTCGSAGPRPGPRAGTRGPAACPAPARQPGQHGRLSAWDPAPAAGHARDPAPGASHVLGARGTCPTSTPLAHVPPQPARA